MGWLFLLGCGPEAGSSTGSTSGQNVEIPAGMALIPAGTFMMGGKTAQAYSNEFPRHEVSVKAFLMDETEVTNAQFLEFAEATGYITVAEKKVDWEEIRLQLPAGTPKPPDSVLEAGSLVFQPTDRPVDLNDFSQWWRWTIKADWRHPEGPASSIEGRMQHPVVHIAWEDAVAYAAWAGKRLPTEAEWEWAAMGGNTSNTYPWGNEPPEQAVGKANFWQGRFPVQNFALDGYEATAPVKAFPPNGYGLYDMAGNVWEWCADKFDVRAYEKYAQQGLVSNPQGSDQYNDPLEPNAPKHIMRGGSFLCNDDYCSGYRVSRRMSSTKDSGANHIGFRCVQDL